MGTSVRRRCERPSARSLAIHLSKAGSELQKPFQSSTPGLVVGEGRKSVDGVDKTPQSPCLKSKFPGFPLEITSHSDRKEGEKVR